MKKDRALDMAYLSLSEDKLPNVRNASPVADKTAMAIATFGGVGYLPIVPATWGSLVTAALYFLFLHADERFAVTASLFKTTPLSTEMSAKAALVIVIVFVVLIGTWAASRVTYITGKKDPRIIVIDEVAGQLITFLFLPAMIGWFFLVVGFFTFRFFDIWKPYPARQLENLPSGFGVMADDVMAGIYSAVFLWVVYSVAG